MTLIRRFGSRAEFLDFGGGIQFFVIFFLFLFVPFRQSLNHQAVARHEPLVVEKRDTDVCRFPREDVIGETC